MTDDQITNLRQSMEVYAETVRKLEAIVRDQGKHIAALGGRIAALEARVPRQPEPEHGHSPHPAEEPLMGSMAVLERVGVTVDEPECPGCQ